jgi:hypothetical protein
MAMADACGLTGHGKRVQQGVVERFKREERLGFYEIEGRLKERHHRNLTR